MSNFEENSSKLYERFEDELTEADCEINASELHGILSGMISAGLKEPNQAWQSIILDIANQAQPFSEKTQESLEKLFSQSHKAFVEQETLAPILLPSDDYPLVDQIEALSVWCQGYLLGFGLQRGDKSIENPEVKESLSDLSEISNMKIEAEDSEEAQANLITLIEHIKVAAKVIYLEIVYKVDSKETVSMPSNTRIH